MLLAKAGDDVECNVIEVDDPRVSLALRLRRHEHDATVLEIDVAGFHRDGFLRTAAGLPEKPKELLEVGPGILEHRVELGGAQDHFPALLRRSASARDGTRGEIPLADEPAEARSDGLHGAGLRRVRPIGLVEPRRDVLRLQLSRRQRPDGIAERLEVVQIDLVRPGRPVLLAPVEERVDQGRRRFRRNDRLIDGDAAELVPAFVGGVLIRLALDELHLTAFAALAAVEVPPAVELTKPRS